MCQVISPQLKLYDGEWAASYSLRCAGEKKIFITIYTSAKTEQTRFPFVLKEKKSTLHLFSSKMDILQTCKVEF